MLQTKRSVVQPPKISFVTANKWDKGLYTRLDRDRVPVDGISFGENVQLSQNGTIGPRPGLKLWGVQPVGTVIGQVYEFVRFASGLPETWNIWFEDRSGTGYVIVSKDGGAHTVATGATYTVASASPHFEQIYGNVLITTGVNALSYMDVQTFAITSFSALATPTAVSAVATGVSGSTYTLRYRVAATSTVGETIASTAQTVGITKLRELWNGTSEFVTFTFNRLTGAQRYNIYVGDSVGNEFFIDSVPDAGSGSTQAYVDTGSIAQASTRIAPVGNSTAGPKVTRATNIKGQPYLVGDTENLGRIWFGGNGTSALDFSSFNGGGWVEPNKGGKDFPVVIKPFRDGKGTPMAVAVSKGTNGSGKRYLLQPTTTTVGTTVISYMSVQEDNGTDGTDSPDGLVITNDALWYPSRGGFKTTNTRAQIQNILSTQGISDNISTDVMSLSSKFMESCVGLVYDQRIYWALPYASENNNQIWMLDLRQQGAWMRPFHIAADWMWLYADNVSGDTKMLLLVNNKFYEFDDNTKTNDQGTTFQTTIGSGELKFGKNGEYASVIDVTFYMLRAQGNIDLSVNANTEDGLVPFTETMSTTANQVTSAHGRFGWGGSGWGQLAGNLLPLSTAKARKKWTIEIDEECDSISWGVGTTESGCDYELSEVVIRYVPIGYKEVDN